MTHVCRQCSRINPPDAAYCYWDGAILVSGAGGPINAGSAPFPSQFIFPGGQACRNFDQLAMTCQQNWKAAVELLQQGFFATFLGGLGRADLALAAQEAAKYPDPDRGLDQLLAKLPTQVLQSPKIQVEPTIINLGLLPMGSDRKTDLHLSNLGMRLAYGSVSSDCKWLTLGEGQGAGQKLFQFGAEINIPVHVKGQFLRGGNQPLEGYLVVDSNGGNVTVTVQADVPITPFTEGVLAGSLTPRQIAEKARAHPKEAAALFEKALVSKWFTKNGWIYPVQGPTVAGLGGVQQFFEALGLARAPKVELKTPSLQLSGDPGQTLTASIEVATNDKKHVFAFAISERPWVVPGQQPKKGKSPTSATIPLTIHVPPTPGQVLQTRITVTANGNQKFTVPLALTVSGSPGDYVPVQAIALTAGASEGEAVPIMAMPIIAVPTPAAARENGVRASHVPGVMAAEIILVPPASSAYAFDDIPSRISKAPYQPEIAVAGRSAFPIDDKSGRQPSDPVIAFSTGKKKRGKSLWFHLLPLGALSLVLAILMIRDIIGKPPMDGTGLESTGVDKTTRLGLFFDFGNEADLGNTMNFGLVAVDPQNVKDPNPKRLTYDHRGRTNSTVALIDGMEKVFGKVPSSGKWVAKPVNAGEYGGKSATFQFSPDNLFVTQTVQIMPGEAYETAAGTGIFQRSLNTTLIKYKVENKDAHKHAVGLRVMIDTLIGQNDGVPFTIPGMTGLVSTSKDFRKNSEIPDFIQALEEPDLEHPGTIVQMNLKLADKWAPDRVSLTHWPGPYFPNWEVRVQNIGDDSAIVLYWNPKDLYPGDHREMAFSYGLGNLKGGKVGLTVGGTLAVGREMTVVAYVANPQPGEKVTLELPQGFELLGGYAATQNVPQAEHSPDGKVRPSPVTWRVRPTRDGRHALTVTTSTNLSVSQPVTIRKEGIF